MKIFIPCCSVCKTPYNFISGIKYDESKCYIMLPLCKHDEKHIDGYTDELLEIDID